MSINRNLTNLHLLSEQAQKEALYKYHLIQPFLKKTKTLTAICKKHHLSLRTIKRWVTNYREKGLIGLARQPRKDKDKKRCCSPELQQLVEGLYLQQPHLSKASIYRKIKEYSRKSSNPYPSYRTVCAIISKLPTGLTTLAHKGRKIYKQHFDLLCKHEAKRPNELWQADHMQLDILILQEGNRKADRPWLTIIIDDHSRAVAGYELSFLPPSAIKTSLCLRQAIWRKKEPEWIICGIPSILYTDHGSDFTSKHIEQVCIDLSIELVFSTVAEGWPLTR